jgi:hypothetical protein
LGVKSVQKFRDRPDLADCCLTTIFIERPANSQNRTLGQSGRHVHTGGHSIQTPLMAAICNRIYRYQLKGQHWQRGLNVTLPLDYLFIGKMHVRQH